MDTLGRHLLAEYRGCDAAILNDEAQIEALMQAAAKAAGATVLLTAFRRFEPHGVTGVVVVSESHLSIHTWPEANYAAVDVFTCGETDCYAAHAVLMAGLGATHEETLLVERGASAPGESMRVLDRCATPRLREVGT